MDARSFANKTKKLTKTEKNAIIGKKCANVCGYKTSAESQSSECENQNLQRSGVTGVTQTVNTLVENINLSSKN